MLFTMVVMSAFLEFTGAGVRNGAQIKTLQERKETRTRADAREGCWFRFCDTITCIVVFFAYFAFDHMAPFFHSVQEFDSRIISSLDN